MKKKSVFFIPVIAVFIACMTSVNATTNVIQYASLSTEALAYCDLSTAPEVWHDDILLARNDIIYSTSWTVDGQVELILEDGTVQQLPEFSDLFPDWDIPVNNSYSNQSASTRTANYVGYVYLQAPSATETTPVFYTFFPLSNRITMGMDSFAGTSWNGGFEDISTGTEIGYSAGMAKTTVLNLTNPNTSNAYGARASTNSTAGYAMMYVTENPM